MKSYLLLPAGRRELLHQQGGRLVEASAGARGVESLLQVGSIGPAGHFVVCMLVWPTIPSPQPLLQLFNPHSLCLQDRSFICLHYHLDQQGQLHPVSTTPASAGSNGTAVRYSVEQSNVQLGVMVRKGVGGTCPLRQVWEQLHAAVHTKWGTVFDAGCATMVHVLWLLVPCDA